MITTNITEYLTTLTERGRSDATITTYALVLEKFAERMPTELNAVTKTNIRDYRYWLGLSTRRNTQHHHHKKNKKHSCLHTPNANRGG